MKLSDGTIISSSTRPPTLCEISISAFCGSAVFLLVRLSAQLRRDLLHDDARDSRWVAATKIKRWRRHELSELHWMKGTLQKTPSAGCEVLCSSWVRCRKTG